MSEGPRRTAPATVLVRIVKSAPQTLVGLVALLAFSARRGMEWALLAVVVVGGASLFFGWLRWLSFTYEIGDEDLVIAQGLLNRSRRSIPLERIQDVSIEQPPLHRLFGLALVKIETGGGVKDEGALDSVTLAEAHRLRETLRGTRRAARPEADAGEPAVHAEPEPETIFAMGIGRVLYSGLFNFSLIWLAAIFGVLQTFDDFIDWRRLYRVVGREVEAYHSIGQFAGAVVWGVVVTVLLGFVAGVARTLARDYGFRLTHGEGRFRRVRGLLTRSEVVIAERRIQLALVRRGLVSGRLGWASLDFQTLGGSNDAGGRQQVAPFARAEEAARVIAAAGLPRFERDALAPVSSGHVVRAAIRHAGPLALAAGIGGLFLPGLWLALLLLPVPVGLALLRRRNHRYALRDTSLQVMRGVLVRREWTLPYGAVQVVSIRRGPLRRLLGIATVAVDTAGASGSHRPDVVDLGMADAVALAQGLLARA
ncbi:MAG: PH domain-containing protein [Sphingomonas sp.]